MRKRWFLAVVVGIMALALLLPACAAPAPEVITLKYSAWTKPPPNPFGMTVDWCMRQVESRSNGRVKFEEYWLGSLIPAKSEVEAMGKGVADICTVFQPFVKSRLTLIDVAALPGFGTSLREQGPAMFELVKMKAIKDQFDKNNLVFMWVQGGDPIDVITKGKAVRTVDDLKGLKIRSAGDQAKALKALGAVPVSLTSTECPEALERGTVDGICMSYVGMKVWALQDFGDYHTEIFVNTNLFYTFMNKDSWLALPDDIKKIFEDVADESAATLIRIYEENIGTFKNEVWPAAGVEIIELSAADKAKIAEASMATWDAWAKKQNEAGLAGTEVLNKWKEIRGLK